MILSDNAVPVNSQEKKIEQVTEILWQYPVLGEKTNDFLGIFVIIYRSDSKIKIDNYSRYIPLI